MKDKEKSGNDFIKKVKKVVDVWLLWRYIINRCHQATDSSII